MTNPPPALSVRLPLRHCETLQEIVVCICASIRTRLNHKSIM
ncbi:hypothetical protein [Helicobacter rodentium]|nr:hypothetical protein [Helicobacter rodentium]